ncbi:MAG: hypothetical protein QNK28_05420, partial [Desulfobacterales bacterium]|nr:hypothetical protein [Desulfobacterales bacterium]
MLEMTEILLSWPNETISKKDFLLQSGEETLNESISNLYIFKRLEERGYGDILLARYPSLRKYFSEFIKLPFAIEPGNEDLMAAIKTVIKLDAGELKSIPDKIPVSFIPKELRRALRDRSGKINRNAWEMGLALAIKDALRSGDLYLPQSKQHVSFWDLMLDETSWTSNREESFKELNQPKAGKAKPLLTQQFTASAAKAEKTFGQDGFATIHAGKLRLKRDDKAYIPASVSNLQKAINTSMPAVRIEQLLMEVDQKT